MTSGPDNPAETPEDDPARGLSDPSPDSDSDAPREPHPGPGPDAPHEPLPYRVRARLRGAGRWLRVHARHALVVGVITAVAGALATVGADQLPKLFEEPPPGCPGAGCDGKSPKDSGCAYDATTWEPKEGNPVRIHLRYSESCGAVWGRIVNGEPGDMVTLRVSGGAARSASIDYRHDKYTTMATVGPTFRVRLCAVPTTIPRRTVTWVKYCFEATEHVPWE
ncbi:DUF2690 domain-containing protein [Streptomyces nigrescens]|uniref:DUF2690 domain-containing protein n=1 Tax=Streptomyces nigrescens TaxID=1920 RepID=UPI0034785469